MSSAGAHGGLRALLCAVNGQLAHDWRTRRCLADVHHYITRGVDMNRLPVVEAAEQEISAAASPGAPERQADGGLQAGASEEADFEAEDRLRMNTVHRALQIDRIASKFVEPDSKRHTAHTPHLKVAARRMMFASFLSSSAPQKRSPHDNWACTSCRKENFHYLYSIYSTGSNGEKLFQVPSVWRGRRARTRQKGAYCRKVCCGTDHVLQVRDECVHCNAKRPLCFCEACTSHFTSSKFSRASASTDSAKPSGESSNSTKPSQESINSKFSRASTSTNDSAKPSPEGSSSNLSVPTEPSRREDDSDEETNMGTLQLYEAFKERPNYLKAQKAILWWSCGGLLKSFEAWKRLATDGKRCRADAKMLNRYCMLRLL